MPVRRFIRVTGGGADVARLIKSRQRKRGLQPGTLVHIGDSRAASTVITVASYSQDSFSEEAIDSSDPYVRVGDNDRIVWINLEGVTEVEPLRRVGECCGLHPLVMEDVVNTDQRPKVEEYDGYLFIVLKILDNDDAGKLIMEQLSLILGRGWLLTVQEGLTTDPFQEVRERLRTAKGRVRGEGADYLTYSLLDCVIDQYFDVIERLVERIEQLEDEVTGTPTRFTIRKIHRLRQELIQIRRSVWPLRELIGSLERRESCLIGEDVLVYMRDLYDHTVQIIDTIEASRDTLAGLIDIYLSSAANRTNEVMKILTIYATIFMPLTFIAGLYGMNFRNLPGLELPWGYPAVLAVMLLLVIGMVIYFRKRQWLGRNPR